VGGILPAPVLFDTVSGKTTLVGGLKARLSRHFLFSANVLVDALKNGMSYQPSPIATLSYDFQKSEQNR
jgi:hypothetical protein